MALPENSSRSLHDVAYQHDSEEEADFVEEEVVGQEDGRTAYERERDARMQDNMRKLQDLGVDKAKSDLEAMGRAARPQKHKAPKPRAARPADAEPARRSIRAQDKPPPCYNENDAFDNLPRATAVRVKKERTAKEPKQPKRPRETKARGFTGNWHVVMGTASEEARAQAKSAAQAEADKIKKKKGIVSVKVMLRSMVSDGFWCQLDTDFAKQFSQVCPEGKNGRKIHMSLRGDSATKTEIVFMPGRSGLSGGWRTYAIKWAMFPSDCVLMRKVDEDNIDTEIFRAYDYDAPFKQQHLAIMAQPDKYFGRITEWQEAHTVKTEDNGEDNGKGKEAMMGSNARDNKARDSKARDGKVKDSNARDSEAGDSKARYSKARDSRAKSAKAKRGAKEVAMDETGLSTSGQHGADGEGVQGGSVRGVKRARRDAGASAKEGAVARTSALEPQAQAQACSPPPKPSPKPATKPARKRAPKTASAVVEGAGVKAEAKVAPKTLAAAPTTLPTVAAAPNATVAAPETVATAPQQAATDPQAVASTPSKAVVKAVFKAATDAVVAAPAGLTCAALTAIGSDEAEQEWAAGADATEACRSSHSSRSQAASVSGFESASKGVSDDCTSPDAAAHGCAGTQTGTSGHVGTAAATADVPLAEHTAADASAGPADGCKEPAGKGAAVKATTAQKGTAGNTGAAKAARVPPKLKGVQKKISNWRERPMFIRNARSKADRPAAADDQQ